LDSSNDGECSFDLQILFLFAFVQLAHRPSTTNDSRFALNKIHLTCFHASPEISPIEKHLKSLDSEKYLRRFCCGNSVWRWG